MMKLQIGHHAVYILEVQLIPVDASCKVNTDKSIDRYRCVCIPIKKIFFRHTGPLIGYSP